MDKFNRTTGYILSSFNLFDIQGRKLKTFNVDYTNTITISSLAGGWYTLVPRINSAYPIRFFKQ
jgi:hypothetical protein